MAGRSLGAIGAATLLLGLAGCGGSGGPPSAEAPAPTTGVQNPASVDVIPCLVQQVGSGPTTVNLTNIILPDTVKIDFARPAGFPNGRRLQDPVIDLILAVAFIDLSKHPVTVLNAIPVNPAANDLPFRPTFPYLAAAQGNPPLPAPGGSNFNFRTDPASAFVRIDRMGVPAVATVVISSAAKVPFNDADPATDATGQFVPEIQNTLTGLSRALADDFDKLGLARCARTM